MMQGVVLLGLGRRFTSVLDDELFVKRFDSTFALNQHRLAAAV